MRRSRLCFRVRHDVATVYHRFTRSEKIDVHHLMNEELSSICECCEIDYHFSKYYSAFFNRQKTWRRMKKRQLLIRVDVTNTIYWFVNRLSTHDRRAMRQFIKKMFIEIVVNKRDGFRKVYYDKKEEQIIGITLPKRPRRKDNFKNVENPRPYHRQKISRSGNIND